MARHSAPRVPRRYVRRSVRATWRGSVRVARVLAMLALAATWVALLLLLLTLSLAMGKGGESVRKGVTENMLTPLGEGARQALASRPQSVGMRALAGLQKSHA